MACVGIGQDINLSKIEWFQITPLLHQADSVVLRKYETGGSEDKLLNTFYLISIDWNLSSVDNSTIATLRSVLKNNGGLGTYDVEKFDFTSSTITFVFDSSKNEIYATTGVGVSTIKYVFEFKGTQSISSKDLLSKSGQCATNNIKVVAL